MLFDHGLPKTITIIDVWLRLSLSLFIFQIITVNPLIKLYVFAYANDTYLLNIHTEPIAVRTGESFKLNATVVNNSSSTITFENGCGIAPLFAEFDRNVKISNRDVITCQAIITDSLKPGKNISIVGPSADKVYNASAPGTTESKVTFEYQIQLPNNKTQVANTSKQYIFNVY
jgi:hypothetical protein